MPRKRITPGAREGLISTISVALYQPVPDIYRTWVTGTNGFAILKVRKPFRDFINVLQWLHTAVSTCKEDEIVSAYCARVELVIKRGPAYYERHSTQQVIEGKRIRRAPVRLCDFDDAATFYDADAI